MINGVRQQSLAFGSKFGKETQALLKENTSRLTEESMKNIKEIAKDGNDTVTVTIHANPRFAVKKISGWELSLKDSKYPNGGSQVVATPSNRDGIFRSLNELFAQIKSTNFKQFAEEVLKPEHEKITAKINREKRMERQFEKLFCKENDSGIIQKEGDEIVFPVDELNGDALDNLTTLSKNKALTKRAGIVLKGDGLEIVSREHSIPPVRIFSSSADCDAEEARQMNKALSELSPKYIMNILDNHIKVATAEQATDAANQKTLDSIFA